MQDPQRTGGENGSCCEGWVHWTESHGVGPHALLSALLRGAPHLASPRLALLCFALLFALRAIGSSSELVLVPANQALVGTVGGILLHMCHKAVELGPRRSAWTEASTRC